MDKDKLREAGIDPDTSEGKLFLRTLMLEGLDFARKNSVRGRANPYMRGWSGQETDAIDSFLVEE